MSDINQKFRELKQKGLDLGAALGPEEDAGFGGRFQRFERGHIYSSPSTGAHEVHGGILDLYLKNGGPGVSPISGARDLGFPKSDEGKMPGSLIPVSRFEKGAIYFVPGTKGVVLHGLIHTFFERSSLGLPLIGNIPRAGGQAAFFERGVIYIPQGVPGVTLPIIGRFELPLMGQPQIVDLSSRRLGFQVRWNELKQETFKALTAFKASVFTEIVQGMFSVGETGFPFSQLQLKNNSVRLEDETQFFTDVVISFTKSPGNAAGDLKERTLYDLRLNLPDGLSYQLSPHCMYVKSNWDDFGLLHITDIHVCARNQRHRAMLEARGLLEASQNYANCQDNLIDFIKYANHLHALGLADAVIATGDLVDYVAEQTDIFGEENFERLRRILLGEPFLPGMSPTEPLKIPIFMTFGNHDYRLNPYDLLSNINLPGNKKALNEHSSHNLLESDALALQDGKVPEYTLSNLEGAGRMIEYDRFDNRYAYFKKYFTEKRTYIVRLGKHRLVVMDTRFDNGIPDDFDLLTLLSVSDSFLTPDFIFGDAPATKKLIAGGSPDSIGFGPSELNLLRSAVTEAGSDGIVIVGMHCPAISPKGNEYAYFHRETIHPTADPALTEAYLERHGISDGSSWTRTGTPFFKTGPIADGMDEGVIATRGQEFLEICAGVGLPRPVDLVLWGHHHDRVEYRIRRDDATGNLEYYMDFYSENPKSYYHTINGVDIPGLARLPKNSVLRVQVEPGAPLPPELTIVRDNRIHTTFGVVKTPAFADPLNSTTDPRAWWNSHRPLLAQTSALGPIDPRQRFGKFFFLQIPDILPGEHSVQPIRNVIETDGSPPLFAVEEVFPRVRVVQPTFQGFRLVQVKNGVIAKIRYVVLGELRKDNFHTPWEEEFQGVHGGITPPHPFKPPLILNP